MQNPVSWFRLSENENPNCAQFRFWAQSRFLNFRQLERVSWILHLKYACKKCRKSHFLAKMLQHTDRRTRFTHLFPWPNLYLANTIALCSWRRPFKLFKTFFAKDLRIHGILLFPPRICVTGFWNFTRMLSLCHNFFVFTPEICSNLSVFWVIFCVALSSRKQKQCDQVVS